MIYEIILFFILIAFLYFHSKGFFDLKQKEKNKISINNLLLDNTKIILNNKNDFILEIKNTLLDTRNKYFSNYSDSDLIDIKNEEEKVINKKENNDLLDNQKELVDSLNDEKIEEELIDIKNNLIDLKEKILSDSDLSIIYKIILDNKEYLSNKSLEAISKALFDYAVNSEDSSVVRDFSEELTEYSSSFELLSKIKLKEHVKDVCEEFLKMAKDLPGFFNSVFEPYMILAIFHDIGKLKIHREKFNSQGSNYRMLDHPLISVEILKEYYSDISEDIIEAIKLHHKPIHVSDNEYFRALKQADSKARERELKKLSKFAKKLEEIISKEQLQALILDSFSESNLNKDWPDFILIDGYLLIKKDNFIYLIEKYLRQINTISQEQILSRELFENSIIELFVKYNFIKEEILNANLFLEKEYFSRKRRFKLKNYIPIAIENLGISEEKSVSFKGFNKLIIQI